MTRSSRASAVALALLTAAASHAALAWDRGRPTVFATLPEGATGPEGLEVGPGGDVYVATFGFDATGPAAGEGQIHVFDRTGAPLRQLSVAGSTSHLLGLRFHPLTGALLVVDFGAGQVLDVDPLTGDATPFLTLPATLPQPGGAGLNDLTFDAAGNVYVSDSFQGVIWRTPASGGVATAWLDSPLLRTSGVPPFGANGLRFDSRGTALFVANTGNDTVVRIPVANGAPGTPAVFANGINGADGLLVDEDDDVWVVANQADEIVVLDPTGRAIAKLGDFDGLRDGSPVGMLFPASLRLAGNSVLVTNLSLDLRLFDPSLTSADSAWCAQVSRYTVVRLPARIPRGAGPPR
jgi:DNA-binding beta-propeller fold protein YncE